MTPMNIAQRYRLAELPRMKRCERWNDGGCAGRITFEHAFGRKIGNRHAPDETVIALCIYHHLGMGLSKERNRHIAYKYMDDKLLDTFKLGEQMKQEKNYLNSVYGQGVYG